MDLAKESIRNFLKSTASNVSVGIMVYGNKGSNAASAKGVSCASAEVIAPLGSVTSSSIDGYLNQIQPVGWTPIGLAIQRGKNAFTGKEGQKNQMIIVTDGAETCSTNPAGAASEVRASPFQIRVDVIGFAVTTADQASLQAISTNGGGLFSVAANADQLLSQMRASHENFNKFQAEAKCTTAVYQTSVTCLQDAQKKAADYLSSAVASAKGAEWNELTTLQSKISTQYYKQISAWQDEQSASYKNTQQRLLK
jgi:Ca-activated chloride channel homolog